MYEYVKEYEGDLKPLIALLPQFDYKNSPQGYRATNATQVAKIIELYHPLLRDILPGQWIEAMITTILPEGIIPHHLDGAIKGTRYHLILESNDMSWCMHDKEWQKLPVGSIYKMDCTKVHGSINWGETQRTHLVVDVA